MRVIRNRGRSEVDTRSDQTRFLSLLSSFFEPRYAREKIAIRSEKCDAIAHLSEISGAFSHISLAQLAH